MYQHVYCVCLPQNSLERAPGSLVFMTGVCETVGVEYSVTDLNVELHKRLDKNTWNELHALTKVDRISADYISSADYKTINDFFDHQVTTIINSRADLLALTVFSELQINWARWFLQRVRLQTNITVIIGGPGVSGSERRSAHGQKMCQDNLIDYWVDGEGDDVFPQFIQGNTVQLGLNSKTTLLSSVPQIDNLDNTPFDSYKKISITDYDILRDNRRVVGLNTSRGCVRKCTFCSVPTMWKKFKQKSAKRIINEIIKYHSETGVIDYYFQDSLMNGSIKVFQEFCNQLIELKQKDLQYRDINYSGLFIVRPKEQHPESLFRAIAESGNDHICIGVETGSDRLRAEMDKRFTNEDLYWHLEMSSKYGIKNQLMMFCSHYKETQDDFNQSLKLLTQIKHYTLDQTIMDINFATPFMLVDNTPDYYMIDNAELYLDPTFDVLQQNWLTPQNPELTHKEKYRRWVEFVIQALELGYTLSDYTSSYVMLNVEKIINNELK